MKIGLPKLRLSRKLLLITLGITVLLGGTGVTALYFGGAGLMLESGENAIGGECTDLQTMVIKTPSNYLWLRKFIRMENASGPDRVRTALRIAGLLAKKNTVDLVHVSVLDSHGPTIRSQMRARFIGAEVLIALKPDNLPEMKSPAMASYYEGPVSDEGRYYGDKVVVDIAEIGAMMTAMRTVEEKQDCVSLSADAKDAAIEKDHGKQEEGKAKPADLNAGPAKEESFLDSMLAMVGLGGGKEKPAAEPAPAAIDANPAVAEEPADAAPEGHGDETQVEHDAKPADHPGKAAAESQEAVAKPDTNDTTPKPADAAADTQGHAPAGADDANAATRDDESPAENKHPARDAKPVTEGRDAEEPAVMPVKSEDQARSKSNAGGDAEARMPVGD